MQWNKCNMKTYMLISVLFFSQSGLIFCETIDLCADDCIIEKKLSLKAEGDEVIFEGNYYINY